MRSSHPWERSLRGKGISMNDCVFCKIIEGKIPASKIYEGDNVIGFKDLRPQAPGHYLFIHRNHSRDVNQLMNQDPSQLVELFQAIQSFTEACSLGTNGFRIVTNSGADAGQTVFHTHFHVLGEGPLGNFGA
jgi:histidine triad (HIT) family protein